MKNDGIDPKQMEALERKAFFSSFESNHSPMKVLLGIYKGNYHLLLRSFLFYCIQYLPCITLPLVTAALINAAANSENRSMVFLLSIVAAQALATLINVPATYCATKNRSIANRRVEAGLRSAMARKLQQLSMTFYKDMESGRIQTKIMRDVENIEVLVTTLFSNMVAVSLSLISAVMVTLTKSRVVFLFFMVTIPAAVLLIQAFRRRLRSANRNYRKDVEKANASVNEMVELLPVTKAHALEETAIHRFDDLLYHVADSGHALDCNTALFGATSWVVFQLFQLCSLTFTSFMAFRGVIGVGDITLFQSYFSSVVNSVNVILSMLPVISKGFDSVRSVGDIMWAMDIEDDHNKRCITSITGAYSFRNVQFSYPDADHPILRGFNMEVKAGETIALVGESGSGKSTLLNMIIGFYHPTGGQMLLDGVDMNEINLKSYRQHIATVPQTSVLFAGTVRDNITYGLDHYSDEELMNAIRVANLEDVIAALPQGLDTNVGEHGDKLSGGQRQRISIARAIIRDARVVIFDEATSALDTVSEKLIQDALDKMAKNRTTFIVAHRLSTIRNADKIAVVKDGVCAEFGTWEELMALKGEFYRFKSLQT